LISVRSQHKKKRKKEEKYEGLFPVPTEPQITEAGVSGLLVYVWDSRPNKKEGENLGPTYHWFHYPVNTDIDLKQLKEQIQEKTVSRETYRLEKEKKKKADKLVVEGDFYATPQESSLVQNNNKIQVKKNKNITIQRGKDAEEVKLLVFLIKNIK